jgi:hypothetical protein
MSFFKMKRKQASRFTVKKKQRINKTKKIVNHCTGYKAYTLNGLLHRTNGPARIGRNSSSWYKHGKLHRINGPAVVTSTECNWYRNGEIHRDGDLPAIECKVDMSNWWFQHGRIHRDNDKPAYMSDHRQAWYRHGERHRLTGPSVLRRYMYSEWEREYWIYNEKYTESDFKRVIGNTKRMIRNIKLRRFVRLCRSKAFNEYFYSAGQMGRKWDIKKIERLDNLIQ